MTISLKFCRLKGRQMVLESEFSHVCFKLLETFRLIVYENKTSGT